MSSHEPYQGINWKEFYRKEHAKVLDLEKKIEDIKLEYAFDISQCKSRILFLENRIKLIC
jgi:hypothetical protein